MISATDPRALRLRLRLRFPKNGFQSDQDLRPSIAAAPSDFFYIMQTGLERGFGIQFGWSVIRRVWQIARFRFLLEETEIQNDLKGRDRGYD